MPFSSASVRSNPSGPPGSSVPLGTLTTSSSPKSKPTPVPELLVDHDESLKPASVHCGGTLTEVASSEPLAGTSALVVLTSPTSVTDDVLDNKPYDTSVTCRG